MALDWADIAVHAVIGALVGILAALSGMWLLIPLNAAGWFLRERLQHMGNVDYPFGASMQTNLEWVVPTATCCIVAAIGWTMR